MSTRSERDKQKNLQEKHQALLAQLLKEEDNKYCVDCDAKGPRWASWNLGIFLCIRCAGIHRNLGVHISKVKSVNLDSWTSEQLGMVQEMGNSRARAVYEANLPDHFRRPQTDSSLEAFIRAKYEQKKYIAKEWIPPQPKVQNVVSEEKKEKKKSRPRPSSNIQLPGGQSNSSTNSTSSSSSTRKQETKVANGTAPAPAPPKSVQPPKKESAIDDLLGLDNPAPASATSPNSDPFSDFISAGSTQPASQEVQGASSSQNTQNSNKDSLSDLSLFGENSGGGENKKSTKESILALYGSSGGQQQMFGVPGGMYMPQQQPQQQQQAQQMNMMGGMQNGMMPANMMQGNMAMMGVPGAAGNMMATGMQGNMMGGMGQMGGVQSGAMMGGMMGQQPGAGGMMMQGNANMYNMGAMYGMQPQQQQQMAQVQNQMASMNLGAQTMGGFQQPGTVTAGGGWGAAPAGQTLSNNLWQ